MLSFCAALADSLSVLSRLPKQRKGIILAKALIFNLVKESREELAQVSGACLIGNLVSLYKSTESSPFTAVDLFGNGDFTEGAILIHGPNFNRDIRNIQESKTSDPSRGYRFAHDHIQLSRLHRAAYC